MLVAMGPISGRVTVVVSLVQINVLGNEHARTVSKTFPRCDVQARETASVSYLRVTCKVDELRDDVLHVALGGDVHRSVASNVIVVFYVNLRFSFEQDLDDRFVLRLYSILHTHRGH